MSEPPHGIRIGPTTDGKGRGVFATRPIAEGEVVELAPVVVIAPSTSRYVSRTVLNDYVFGWGDDNPPTTSSSSAAVRDIAAGEELMTNDAGHVTGRAAFLQHLH